MDNQDNNDLEVYRDDNSFNNNGIETPQTDQNIDIPSPNNSQIPNNYNFAHGIGQGVKDSNNNKNLALGQNKMNNNPLAGSNKSLNNDKDNPAIGNNNTNDKNNNELSKNNSNNNKLPGTIPNKKPNNNQNNDKNKPNNKKSIEPKNEKEGFNPRKTLQGLTPGGIANNIRSKLGLGNAKNQEGQGENDDNQSPTSNLGNKLKNIVASLPLQAKVVIASSTIIFVIIFFLMLIIFTATTATLINSKCDNPSYSVNSSDATEFLCNMQSPFQDGGYVVTGVSGWRYHPDGGGIKFHYGTDVVGNGGSKQKIYAVADGTIEIAGNYSGYGNAVKINHNGNFTTLYGHLSSISSSLKKGDSVTAGTYLGIQGNTGRSYGVHLHFEVADSSGKYVSANPFFGYSDQGYEECIDPDKKVSGSSECVKSDTPKARHIGKDGFAQICGKPVAFTTNASSSNSCCGTKTTTSTSGSLIDFIGTFEGGVGTSYQCKTSSGEAGYKVYNHGDLNTVGPGITTDYIKGMKVGDCVSKKKVEEAMNQAISAKRNSIQSTFAGANLTQYQEDAMVSMKYNGCGTFFDGIAKAAKEDNYEKVWKAMKECYHSNGKALEGLKRRRKAEFALYVTGDYTVAESYKSKSWTTAEYDNYDSDGVMAKKMSGTSSNSCSSASSGSSGNKVIDVAIKELEQWNSYNKEDQYCTAVKKYIKACSGGSTINDYCAGFVTYALKEAGVFDSLGLPKTTCVVSDLKKSSKVTVHDAGGSYSPKPGDLFIKVDSNGNDWGHIGIVEKVTGKTIHTIEGNTDPFEGFCSKGVSDGHGGTVGNGNVRRKTHTEGPKDITHYISY